VDIDSQGNASSGLGINYKDLDGGMYEVLIPGPVNIKHVILSTSLEGLHLAPATPNLAGASVDLVSLDEREFQLFNSLKVVQDYYDFILIDCPPSLGLITINALTAADDVLIPVQCEYYAMEGIADLQRTIQLVKNSLNKDLKIRGIILTMFDARNNLSRQVQSEIRNHFKDAVFHVVIPRNVRLSEAPSHGKPILLYDVTSKGAQSYFELAKEVLAASTTTGQEQHNPL